jgi:hypothetical protein
VFPPLGRQNRESATLEGFQVALSFVLGHGSVRVAGRKNDAHDPSGFNVAEHFGKPEVLGRYDHYRFVI